MNRQKKNPLVVIISGKARSGKTTAANYMVEYYKNKNISATSLAYGDTIKEYAKKIMGWDGQEETKPRTFLQELGTEIIRKQIDPDFFIKRMIEDIEVYSYFYDVIIISDARFIDEIEKIKEAFDKVITCNIDRVNIVSNLTEKEQEHITENALNEYKNYHYVIQNDASLETLKMKIDTILDEVKL